MFENWLRYADPGVPRTLAWILAWITSPVIMAVAFPLALFAHGVSSAREICEQTAHDYCWLWRQRATLNSDPWVRVR